MVRAYVDESADEKKQFAYAIAGFVGADVEWLKLELLWQHRTAGIKDFHMTDCESFQEEFKGWSPEKKRDLISDLIGIINGVTLYGFGSSVDVPVFRGIFPDEPDDSLYFLCFRHCVSQMAFMCSQHNQQVAFVFDRNKQFSFRAHQLYDRLRNTPSNYQHGFGSLAFQDRKQFVPLQAADLIAYETYKIAHHAGYDKARTIRRSIARLASTGRVHVRYWDEPVLRATRSEMEKNGFGSLMDWMLTAEFMNLIPERRKQ